MPSFVAIMKWDIGFRVEKSMSFDTQAEADAHVAAHLGTHPDAFVVVDPPGQASDLIADPVAKTVTLDILTPPPPPTNEEVYDIVIQNQKVLKAVVLALNDGTFVPGADVSGAILKAAITSKMAT